MQDLIKESASELEKLIGKYTGLCDNNEKFLCTSDMVESLFLKQREKAFEEGYVKGARFNEGYNVAKREIIEKIIRKTDWYSGDANEPIRKALLEVTESIS